MFAAFLTTALTLCGVGLTFTILDALKCIGCQESWQEDEDFDQ
jgi:hypothetical protein